MEGKLGTIWTRAGHDVVFSYSRTKQKLEGLAREAGGKARAGTPAEAAKDADAVVLAVHRSRVDEGFRGRATFEAMCVAYELIWTTSAQNEKFKIEPLLRPNR